MWRTLLAKVLDIDLHVLRGIASDFQGVRTRYPNGVKLEQSPPAPSSDPAKSSLHLSPALRQRAIGFGFDFPKAPK